MVFPHEFRATSRPDMLGSSRESCRSFEGSLVGSNLTNVTNIISQLSDAALRL